MSLSQHLIIRTKRWHLPHIMIYYSYDDMHLRLLSCMHHLKSRKVHRTTLINICYRFTAGTGFSYNIALISPCFIYKAQNIVPFGKSNICFITHMLKLLFPQDCVVVFMGYWSSALRIWKTIALICYVSKCSRCVIFDHAKCNLHLNLIRVYSLMAVWYQCNCFKHTVE